MNGVQLTSLYVLLVAGCTAPTFLDTFPHGTYANAVESDTRHTWQCVVESLGVAITAKEFPFNQTQYLVVYYDRNEDGKIDLALVYSQLPGSTKHEYRPFPDRYIVQNTPSVVFEYVDMQGNGRCRDIVSVTGNQGETEGQPLARPHGTPVPRQYEIPADPNGEQGERDPKEQA